MLRRGVDRNETCLVDPRNRRLRFEIEMFLAADPERSLDTHWARLETAEVAIDDPKLVGQKTARLDCMFDGQNRREWRVLGGHARGSTLRCTQ
jgi:hypothetical protein